MPCSVNLNLFMFIFPVSGLTGSLVYAQLNKNFIHLPLLGGCYVYRVTIKVLLAVRGDNILSDSDYILLQSDYIL